MVNQVAAGVYTYLPLAWRVMKKIESIVRDEMDRAGGQEVSPPVLQPLELWQLSGRDRALGKVLFTLNDRRERPLALGPTHEEVITQLVSRYVQSYRDLPQRLYQIQTKFRDEPRPRGGLIRGREFAMKDLYSFDTDEAGLDVSYDKMLRAYQNVYARCGLPAMVVEADSGAIGGKDSREFMVVAETGEDEIFYCPDCHYAANGEKAESVKEKVDNGAPRPVEPVATPGMGTIEEVAGFLKIPPNRTLKAVFYVADGQITFVTIRGDLAVNEIKLKNLLKAGELRLATGAEVTGAGMVAGAASPVGLKGIKIVADDSVTTGTNFVAGGNKPDTHLKNVNYPRDFKADVMGDIASARAGDGCPRCPGRLAATHGIEVGHIFKLEYKYTRSMNVTMLSEEGVAVTPIMGTYGIGINRTMAAIVEQHNDEKGIVWPRSVAPFEVHLVRLGKGEMEIRDTDAIYDMLLKEGFEVLYDDRTASPGYKFADADLIGLPIRVTIGKHYFRNGEVEVKQRKETQVHKIEKDGLIDLITALLSVS